MFPTWVCPGSPWVTSGYLRFYNMCGGLWVCVTYLCAQTPVPRRCMFACSAENRLLRMNHYVKVSQGKGSRSLVKPFTLNSFLVRFAQFCLTVSPQKFKHAVCSMWSRTQSDYGSVAAFLNFCGEKLQPNCSNSFFWQRLAEDFLWTHFFEHLKLFSEQVKMSLL